MNLLVHGLSPGDPTDKLCPSTEPKEAMATKGPDGRMVLTSG
jgi:hypothetical protein